MALLLEHGKGIYVSQMMCDLVVEGGSPISKNAMKNILNTILGVGIIGNFGRLNSWGATHL